jgi:MFS family permease
MSVAAMAIFAQGASSVAFSVALASDLQPEASDAFRGRVMSLVQMMASLAQLAGFAGAGLLVEWAGARAAFFIAGSVICAVAIPVVALAFTSARAERLGRLRAGA